MGSTVGSGLSPFGQSAASAIRDSREREKKEMSDLNDKLASYIEKVRLSNENTMGLLGPFLGSPKQEAPSRFGGFAVQMGKRYA